MQRLSLLVRVGFACCSLAGFLAACTHRPIHRASFPEPATLAARTEWPSPLVFLDGAPVKTEAQWNHQRKPELKGLFEHYMYGPIPPKPRELTFVVKDQHSDFLGGSATLKLVTVQSNPGDGPRIDLMIVAPKTPRPAPVFLVMNFCGNHAVTADPRVPLAQTWIRETCKGAVNHAATDASRGAQEQDWPLAEIVRRGYAVATFYSGDVDSDRQEASTGLYAWLAQGDPSRNNPTNRGTISAWAWGFQRCVDYLVTDATIDPRRIAALGHSRNGKTALLAAAFDERIAMAFPHQAGCGGSAPSRGTIGESVKAINDRFPHWFNARFKDFNGQTERLPFDQHCLLALCAPRPVLFSAAQDDQWANPAGQFEVLQAATPLYRFLGSEGLRAERMPPFGVLVDSPLGYYIREGKHSMSADDWRVFMDFADRHFQRK